MGSTNSRPIELHPIPVSKALNKYKHYIPVQTHHLNDENQLITLFIHYFEHEYSTQLPLDIIPIVIYYYNKLTTCKWLQINPILSINSFSLKNKQDYSFGITWQVALKSTSTMYTLQILKKRDIQCQTHQPVLHSTSERKLLSNISHPFIWSIHTSFETKTKLFIVRDFLNGKQLFSYVTEINQGKFTDTMARFYTAEICLAIAHIHSLDMVFVDLSPQNILIDACGHIKISDINICMSSDHNSLLHCYNMNPEYLAPEIVANYATNIHMCYNKMSDWWSIGIILYEMICGLPPFYDTDINQVYNRILYGEVPYYRFMSSCVIDVISKLLRKNVDMRIDFNGLKNEKYFENIEWNKLYKREIEPPFVSNLFCNYDKDINHNHMHDDDENINFSFPENYECYRRRSGSSSILLD